MLPVYAFNDFFFFLCLCFVFLVTREAPWAEVAFELCVILFLNFLSLILSSVLQSGTPVLQADSKIEGSAL